MFSLYDDKSVFDNKSHIMIDIKLTKKSIKDENYCFTMYKQTKNRFCFKTFLNFNILEKKIKTDLTSISIKLRKQWTGLYIHKTKNEVFH